MSLDATGRLRGPARTPAECEPTTAARSCVGLEALFLGNLSCGAGPATAHNKQPYKLNRGLT